MSKPKDTTTPPLSRVENRRRAMAAVQSIFERYHLVQKSTGRPAFDNAVMQNATILDASLGPPYDVPQPSLLPGGTATSTTIKPFALVNLAPGRTREAGRNVQPPGEVEEEEKEEEEEEGRGEAPLLAISPPNTGIVASCTSKLSIGPELANYNGVMHGGAAGVIFDMLTTIALGPVSRPGFWTFLGGVTRTLNISYLKAVPIGTTVIVHAHVYQVGRQTAYIKGWMTSLDSTVTYAVCDHHKIHVPTPREHMALRVPWDDLWDARKVDAHEVKGMARGKL